MCDCAGSAAGVCGFVWVWFEVFVGYATGFVEFGVLLCSEETIAPLYIVWNMRLRLAVFRHGFGWFGSQYG